MPSFNEVQFSAVKRIREEGLREGSGIENTLDMGRGPEEPARAARHAVDVDRQWHDVKAAWGGDYDAYRRYTG